MRRCARCQRPRIRDDATWLGLDEGDICPDCQTEEERRRAHDAAISAVQGEGERRNREGEPPDDVEVALTQWAMAERERTTLRVALTAAFFTGVPIEIHLDDYQRLQDRLGDTLRPAGWKLVEPDRTGTFEAGGGFMDSLPLVIARREGTLPLRELSDGMADETGAPRSEVVVDACRLTASSVRIDVYDLGVAVLTAWFDARTNATELEAVRTIRDSVRLRGETTPLVAGLRHLATRTVEDYDRAVRAQLRARVRPSWLSLFSPDDPPGRLLWVHPLYVVPHPKPSEAAARELAPPRREVVALRDAVFAAGVGWSTLVGEQNMTAVRLTQLHWAYYALYMEMDRGLLGVIDGVRSRRARLGELEDAATSAFGHYQRAMHARVRLDSDLSGLGGDDLQVWQTIADAQRFDAVVESVERKLEVLERVTQRRVDEVQATRTRRVSRALEVLSTLAFASLIVASAAYLVGEPSDGVRGDDRWWLVAVVAGAVLVLNLFMQLYVRRPWRRT